MIGTTLWYTSYRQRLLAAIDLRTGQERQRYHLPGDPTGMCRDGAQLWYCDYMHRQLCAVRLPVFESAAVPSWRLITDLDFVQGKAIVGRGEL
jgi:hypothetical protein